MSQAACLPATLLPCLDACLCIMCLLAAVVPTLSVSLLPAGLPSFRRIYLVGSGASGKTTLCEALRSSARTCSWAAGYTPIREVARQASQAAPCGTSLMRGQTACRCACNGKEAAWTSEEYGRRHRCLRCVCCR